MTALETLRRLAAGERPAVGLLHTARLTAFGSEFYGEEAIVEAFRPGNTELSDAETILASSGHIAVFDTETALFADLHGELIARIWRLGEGQPVARKPALSVAFDPDLAQARGDVFAQASDHPALEPDAFEQVLLTGRSIANDDPASYRTRALCLRAFGSSAEGAALFAVYRLTGQPVRASGFAMAAARWSPEGLRIVRDRSGEAALAEAAWTPRIGV
jgi:hypothetical protein